MFKIKNYLPMNLQLFAGDGGDGNQQPDNVGGDTNQQTDPEQQQQQQSQQSQQPQKQQQLTQPEQQKEKLFTQEDVNNLIARETKKAQERLLKQLGIEDFNSAKEGLQKFREWQESQKTEAEKQAERLKTLETEKTELSAENEKLKAQLSALKAGVKPESVEDVVVLAKNYVNEDTDMDQAIQMVLEKYPQFKAQQDTKPDDQKDPKPTFTTGQHSKKEESELDKWINAFRFKEQYGKQNNK